MTLPRLVRVAVVCAALTAGSVAVAGSTGADSPPRHDFTAAALAIPSAPGTNADDSVARFESAHGRDAKIKGVATTSLTCDGCSGHAVNLQVVYAHTPFAVTADNVATAWASNCSGCSGWALSLQIVVAKAAHAFTAANRALAFSAACYHCDVKAAAVQIAVVATSERQLTWRQTDAVQSLCNELVAALNSDATATSPAPNLRRTAAAPNLSPAITAATEDIQSLVSAALGASSATHRVSVED